MRLTVRAFRELLRDAIDVQLMATSGGGFRADFDVEEALLALGEGWYVAGRTKLTSLDGRREYLCPLRAVGASIGLVHGDFIHAFDRAARDRAGLAWEPVVIEVVA